MRIMIGVVVSTTTIFFVLVVHSGGDTLMPAVVVVFDVASLFLFVRSRVVRPFVNLSEDRCSQFSSESKQREFLKSTVRDLLVVPF